MSWVATAVVGAVVATSVYSADQQRKAIHSQQDALNAAQADDARKTAEAETAAQVAANAKLADSKRRRRSSALGLGDTSAPSGDALGGAGNVLAAGGPSPAARAAVGAASSAAYGGTALGAGAPTSTRAGSGFVSTPRTPSRASAV